MFFLIPLQYMLHFTPCTPPETPLRAIAAAPPLRIGHKSGPRFAAAPLLYFIFAAGNNVPSILYSINPNKINFILFVAWTTRGPNRPHRGA